MNSAQTSQADIRMIKALANHFLGTIGVPDGAGEEVIDVAIAERRTAYANRPAYQKKFEVAMDATTEVVNESAYFVAARSTELYGAAKGLFTRVFLSDNLTQEEADKLFDETQEAMKNPSTETPEPPADAAPKSAKSFKDFFEGQTPEFKEQLKENVKDAVKNTLKADEPAISHHLEENLGLMFYTNEAGEFVIEPLNLENLRDWKLTEGTTKLLEERLRAKQIFDTQFNAIEHEIGYQSTWCNTHSTGYFDGAVKDESLLRHVGMGKMAKSTDPTGRKLIFFGTKFGVAVLFERYVSKMRTVRNAMDASDYPSFHVANLPRELTNFEDVDTGSRIGSEDLHFFFGSAEKDNLALRANRN